LVFKQLWESTFSGNYLGSQERSSSRPSPISTSQFQWFASDETSLANSLSDKRHVITFHVGRLQTGAKKDTWFFKARIDEAQICSDVLESIGTAFAKLLSR
jgi:hypothetical protein